MKKNIMTVLGLVIVVILIVIAVKTPRQEEVMVNNNNDGKQVPVEICYAYEKEQGTTDTGLVLKDEYTLRMSFAGAKGENVVGELRLFPAEKDSKQGVFDGTATPLDQATMSRTANVWWKTSGEGMNVTEELSIKFGDGSAAVGFGAMKDRGDGVYVYSEPNNINYSLQLSQIDCEKI